MRSMTRTLVALILSTFVAIVALADEPSVTDAIAQQRYPWNGKVDITCKVSGINGVTNELEFAVAAIMPNSGEVRNISHFWVVKDETNSTDRSVHTNGYYKIVWDARADLEAALYSNMVVRVTLAGMHDHSKVQLWENGPYWATTNIGADNPWDSGYYFWWGDIVGYKCENGAWVASDGSVSNFSFGLANTPTYGKSSQDLQDEGWIMSDDALAPEHDAAHVQWGGGWRIPTYQEINDINNNCDWIWTTTNGVNGYTVRGKGNYAFASIFLPSAGFVDGTWLRDAGSWGKFWSSVPSSEYSSWFLLFSSKNHLTNYYGTRYNGYPVRPVQDSSDVDILVVAEDSAPFLLDITDGARMSLRLETIRYSTDWDSVAPSDAMAVVTVDGVVLNVSAGTGFVEWAPKTNGTYTLMHRVMVGEIQYGETLTAAFIVDGAPEEPVFSPASGTIFGGSLSVSISCPTEGATVHYTTNGVDPTAESPEYRRFRVGGKITVKAIAVKDGMQSNIVVAEYALGRCADPVITPTNGTEFARSRLMVAVSWNNDGILRYTLDGSDPTLGSLIYGGPFMISESTVVKAKVFSGDYFDSSVVTSRIVRAWGIGDTLGAPDHEFGTEGDGGVGWTRVTDSSAPNGEAMRSGAITHGQTSTLSTIVKGPGTLHFKWRTSCEEDELHEWDHAELRVDGVVVLLLGGITGWQDEAVAISGDGEHAVEWRYVKDDVESTGEDAAWVGDFCWDSAWTATRTTNVPVSYAWLRNLDPEIADEYDAYEAAAKETAANGRKVWECFALGLDPMNPLDAFRITAFYMDGDIPMLEFNHKEDGDGNSFLHLIKLLGKVNIEDSWQYVPDGGNPAFRFFAAEVVLPGIKSIVHDKVQLRENGPH